MQGLFMNIAANLVGIDRESVLGLVLTTIIVGSKFQFNGLDTKGEEPAGVRRVAKWLAPWAA